MLIQAKKGTKRRSSWGHFYRFIKFCRAIRKWSHQFGRITRKICNLTLSQDICSYLQTQFQNQHTLSYNFSISWEFHTFCIFRKVTLRFRMFWRFYDHPSVPSERSSKSVHLVTRRSAGHKLGQGEVLALTPRNSVTNCSCTSTRPFRSACYPATPQYLNEIRDELQPDEWFWIWRNHNHNEPTRVNRCTSMRNGERQR